MNLPELLDWIARYDLWIYGLLLAYCLGKTGPLPMVAGYAASQGALRIDALLMVTVLGSVAGGQLRFALGRFASPWICKTFPKAAPWIALASAGVERYGFRILLSYRFVKGAFSLVGLGAGASLLSWRRFFLIDGSGGHFVDCLHSQHWLGLWTAGGCTRPTVGCLRWASSVGFLSHIVGHIRKTFKAALITFRRKYIERAHREKTSVRGHLRKA